jgi:hypothetical protein
MFVGPAVAAAGAGRPSAGSAGGSTRAADESLLRDATAAWTIDWGAVDAERDEEPTDWNDVGAPIDDDPPPESTVPRPPSGPPPRHPGRFRYVAFGLVFLLLLAAIPALGYTGLERLLDSRGGTTSSRSTSPTEPGYQAFVEKTPAALVIHTDASGAPTGLTMVALGQGEAGGSVVFIPLDTELDRPAFYIKKVRDAYQPGQLGNVTGATERLLYMSFTETIEINDTRWQELIEPVAPLTITNPDEVQFGDATFGAGQLDLAAADVGPYLQATSNNEQDELDRMNRHRLVWEAWIGKVAASGRPDAIPGEIDTGIGKFVSTLAQGEPTFETLPVTPLPKVDGGPQTFLPEVANINDVVTQAVPFPFSSGPGERYTVRLLNGVKGEFLPTTVTDPLVANMAQIDIMGNASKFEQETTLIEYYKADDRESAEKARAALGGGEIKLREGVVESYALTITVGADVMHALEAGVSGAPGDLDGGSTETTVALGGEAGEAGD